MFNVYSSQGETPQSSSKILRCVSIFNSLLSIKSNDETRTCHVSCVMCVRVMFDIVH